MFVKRIGQLFQFLPSRGESWQWTLGGEEGQNLRADT